MSVFREQVELMGRDFQSVFEVNTLEISPQLAMAAVGSGPQG